MKEMRNYLRNSDSLDKAGVAILSLFILSVAKVLPNWTFVPCMIAVIFFVAIMVWVEYDWLMKGKTWKSKT